MTISKSPIDFYVFLFETLLTISWVMCLLIVRVKKERCHIWFLAVSEFHEWHLWHNKEHSISEVYIYKTHHAGLKKCVNNNFLRLENFLKLRKVLYSQRFRNNFIRNLRWTLLLVLTFFWETNTHTGEKKMSFNTKTNYNSTQKPW